MEVAESQKILLPGDLIGNYRIDNFLGQGGFGITYLAHDTMLDIKVAIKEYLPERIAQRLSQHTVRPRSSDDADVYRKGLDNFLKEARTLARFDHPNIVGVRSVFELGGTAYMVMDYERGRDLKYLFDKRKHTTEAALKSIIGPLLDGLKEVHRHGFIHRDIKPANIIIRHDCTPVLLDFGSARLAVGQFTADLTAVVTSGFAPLEQYSGLDDQQGPWSDIYALGAVLYYAVTGNAPEDSTVRGSAVLNGRPDPVKSLSDLAPKGYSRSFCAAIDWALAFRVSARPQTLELWRARLIEGQLQDGTEVLRDPVDLNRYRQITSSLNSSRKISDELVQQPLPGSSSQDDVTVIASGSAISRRSVRSGNIQSVSTARRIAPGRRKATFNFPRINYRVALMLGVVAALVPLAIFVFQQRAEMQGQKLANQANTPNFVDQNSVIAGSSTDLEEAGAGSPSVDGAADLLASENISADAELDDVESTEVENISDQENIIASIPETALPGAPISPTQAQTPVPETPVSEGSAPEIQIPEPERLEAEQAKRKLLAAESEAKRELRPPPAEQPVNNTRQQPLTGGTSLDKPASPQVALGQQRLTTDEPESGLFDAEVASESSGIKPAITDTDMFIVLTRFNGLSSAIRDGDSEEIRELTISSERKNGFFDYVLRTFDEVDVSIKNITASRWDQTIRATLSINRMTRSNGDIAFAPDEFKNIPIFSVKENTWSAVHW